MIYLSVCSGIEAATQAWHPLGWEPAAFSEIEPFPCAVLAHHYPDVPNWGDMTRFEDWPDATVDALCGGTPCQDFSIAGLRAGLDGARGGLMLTYAAVARRYRPKWLVWENVPGVLSSSGGRDFAGLLGLLAGRRIEAPAGGWQSAGVVEGIPRAYGLAWRVLDAQYTRTRRFPWAVPQRRRRVFVVGYLGDWRRAAAVLLDRESLSGNPPPRREQGQVAPTIPSRSLGGGGLGTDFDLDGGLIPMAHGQAGAEIAFGHGPTLTCNHEAPIVAFDCKGSQVQHDESGATPTLRAMGHADSHANGGGQLAVAHSLRAEGFDASEDGTGRGIPLVPVAQAVAFDAQAGGETALAAGDVAGALHGGGKSGGRAAVAHGIQKESPYASAQEGDACSILRELRRQVGAQAFAEWGSGILDSLQSAEVLRSWLHGGGIRRQAGQARPELVHSALACAESLPDRAMRSLWIDGPDGRSPQGRELVEQLAREFGASLPLLPYTDAPWAVRRLTPREAERLQGFPDDFTMIPTARAKHIEADEFAYLRAAYPDMSMEEARRLAADGPRYKALGSSMAVNCMEWIGERIAQVDAPP